MKKKIAILLVILIVATLCFSACDFIGVKCTNHIDRDLDDKCDNCGKSLAIDCGFHLDNNKDGLCDKCGVRINKPCSSHTDTNKDGKCDTCGATVAIPCEHSYDNACDTDCNTCGEVRAVSDHVFDNSCDTTCNVCGVSRDIAHTYDNACDTTCNVCGATRSVGEHVYDNSCDTTCNICEEVREITHAYDNLCDDTCNVCGNTREVGEHLYGGGVCDTDCDYCGEEREAPHQYDNACDDTCNLCGHTRIVGAHVYDDNDDDTCNICQYVRDITCVHSYDNACDRYCNLCGEVRDFAGHQYDNACDTTCNVCGDIRVIAHVYDHACDNTCNECGAIREVAGHVYDNACDGTCNTCGSVRSITHSYTNSCDAICNVCGFARSAGHIYTDECDDICNECNYTRIPPHVDSNRDYYCDICSGRIELECKVHVDQNSDGLCDKCTMQYAVNYNGEVIIDVYSINDLHGKYLDSDAQPGVDELTTYLMQKQDDENAIVLSAGDMWQGTMESGLTYGALMTKWMNEVGFSSMTLGNHEFDWGDEYIESNLALAEFPMLAINVYVDATNTLADYCTPSVMLYVEGVSIGVIGAIGNCESSISSEYVSDISFKVGDELTALVKAESDRLRSNGADYIIYVLHDTYKTSGSYDESLSDGYVDLVFEGHSHSQYVYQDTYGVYHLQGSAENKGLSHAEITFSANTIEVTTDYVSANTYSSSSYVSNPLVDELFEEYESVVGDPYVVIGTNSSYKSDVALEQKIADLYIEYGVNQWGSQYDIVLGGGFIRTRSPYNMSAGDVTRSMIYSLFTFNNNVQLCSIKGSDLKAKFINSESSDYYISYSAYGESIKGSIIDSQTYYIVVDSYTSQYAPNKLTVVANSTPTVYARDLLEEYIASGGFEA